LIKIALMPFPHPGEFPKWLSLQSANRVGDWFDDCVGVGSSVHTGPTIHTLRLCRFGDARDSAAISKTCLPNSLIRAVSGPAFTANEPNSASRLCIENFRS
jgi:hypothetical protein